MIGQERIDAIAKAGLTPGQQAARMAISIVAAAILYGVLNRAGFA